ncbi:MAG: TonB-dependent siderophore receptor [Sphingobacteriaceae bacterium]
MKAKLIKHCLKIYTTLIVLFITTTIKAQTTGSLHGKIVTSDGSPAAFVNVGLKDSDKKTITLENGTFSLRNITTGTYTLKISAVGLNTLEREVVINDKQTSHIDIVLSVSTAQLNEVIIRESKTLNDQPLSIGKIAIRPMDLPQSVLVINKEVLDQQQVLRLSDALKNANGVYQMGNTGGTQEEIAGRGFAFGSNNTFKNGTRFNNGVMPEISALERVEILKGSNAILFGNVAPGGVLNLVTKKPRFDRGGELSYRWGEYNFNKPSIDIYGAVNNSDQVAYRMNATYENAESFRRNVSSERIYVNPSLMYRFSNKTNLLIEADYLKDKRTPDFGIGAINYTISNIPRANFLGAAWANYETTQKSITATLSQQLSNHWNIRAMLTQQNYLSNQYSTSRPTGIKTDGTWVRSLQRSRTDEQYRLAQVDLTGEAFTGSVKHQFLFGADGDRYFTQTPTFAIIYNPNNLSASTYDTINIFDLSQYVQRTDIPAVNVTKMTSSPVNRVGAYVQDLISLSDQVKVLAGLRYTYMDTRSRVLTLADQSSVEAAPRYADAFTPRVGLVYQPLKTMSLFASYANSFNLNTGIDNTGAPLMPSFIDQYEVGMKNELFKGVLSANITAYRIVNSNLAQTILPGAPNYNPSFATAQELAGEVTSKGLEIDLMSKSFNGFTLMGGYSFNETKYTESNVYEIGSKLRYNPAHTANLSLNHQVGNGKAKGFESGFSVLYFGERFAGRSTRLNVPNDAYKLIPLSAFTQVDINLGYTVKRLGIRMKISNLLNELNYFAHDDNSINPIAPRQVATTLTYKL